MSIRAAILGPTGYTGYWLIELLLRHPGAKVSYLASARDHLPNIADEFPTLAGRCNLTCQPIDPDAIAQHADVVFTALPHKAAMEHIPALLEANLRVIDLSADYRLRDAALYERTYQTPHADPENLSIAAYGLPELFADQIRDASLMANPGCYPTASILGIAPLLQRSLVKPDGIIINAASGVTGAGRSPKPHLQFAEVTEGYFAYACGDHRHQPEIEQILGRVKGSDVHTLFVPHLLPIERGILATIYLDPVDDEVTEDELYQAYQEAYADQPFVRPRGAMPNVKHVRQTNFCDIGMRLIRMGEQRKIVVFSAIDNMVKGASGQAIQNMNLMFNQDPTAGLL